MSTDFKALAKTVHDTLTDILLETDYPEGVLMHVDKVAPAPTARHPSWLAVNVAVTDEDGNPPGDFGADDAGVVKVAKKAMKALTKANPALVLATPGPDREAKPKPASGDKVPIVWWLTI